MLRSTTGDTTEEHYQSLEEILDEEKVRVQRVESERDSESPMLGVIRAVTPFIPATLLLSLTTYVDMNVAPHETSMDFYSDQSISAPLMPETVSEQNCSYLSIILPAAIILVVCIAKSDRRLLLCGLLGLIETCAYTGCLTVSMKKLAGSLRPNYKALCGWDSTLKVCTNPAAMVYSSRQSFPSGHSAMIGSGMAYLSVFLYCTLSSPPLFTSPGASPFRAATLRAIVFLPPAGLAMWVASTRLWDLFHRVEDVSVGLALGAAVATSMAYTHLAEYISGRAESVRKINSLGSFSAGNGSGGGGLNALGERERVRTLQHLEV